MIRYGLEWGQTPDASIELYCYKYHHIASRMSNARLREPWEHFKRALQILFPAPHLVWNSWTEIRCRAFCEDDFAVFWGSGASGKSNDFGAFTVADWWADPVNTCTFVCSTTRDMLAVRIWESVIRYHSLHPDNPGTHKKSKMKILLDPNEEDDEDIDAMTVKAGIHGIALLQATGNVQKSNIIGAHLPFVRLILDEMQAIPSSAVDARKNLSLGVHNFKCFGLANPMSLMDPAGRFSTPLKGWKSVTPEYEQWETRWGKVYHFDGFKSPAVVEPDGDIKYPFLINQKQIDQQLKEVQGNRDDPDIWTFIRGWPPPTGARKGVLSEVVVVSNNGLEKAKWDYDYIIIGGLDPAKSAFGDKVILQLLKLGLGVDKDVLLEFFDPISIPLKASSDKGTGYQIAEAVREICEPLGMHPGNLTIDESGVQQNGQIIDEVWGRITGTTIRKVQYQWSPSDIKISIDDEKTPEELYVDLATEMYIAVQKFTMAGHIRNMPETALQQFCEREMLNTKNKKKRLVPKQDVKTILGHSPDEADALALGVDHTRKVHGVFAGSANVTLLQGNDSDDERKESKKKAGLFPTSGKYEANPVTGHSTKGEENVRSVRNTDQKAKARDRFRPKAKRRSTPTAVYSGNAVTGSGPSHRGSKKRSLSTRLEGWG